tara:strand:- start:367 stop:522 length:156 start_codon:yes stop_codon:yes gene_type:complete
MTLPNTKLRNHEGNQWIDRLTANGWDIIYTNGKVILHKGTGTTGSIIHEGI